MSKEKITVSFINPPKEGKKLWTIKTRDDKIFGVFADKKDAFTQGGTYEVEYTSRDYNGKTYHTVKEATPVAGGNGSATNGHSTNGGGSSTSDQIRWQVCLKVSADVHSGNAVPASAIIAYARELFVADPIVEAAKEILNAKPSAEDGPNWE